MLSNFIHTLLFFVIMLGFSAFICWWLWHCITWKDDEDD